MAPTSKIPLGNSAADMKRRSQGSEASTPGAHDHTWITSIVSEVKAGTVARSLVESAGGRLRFVYHHVYNGFAFDGPVGAAAVIRANANVTQVRRVRPRRSNGQDHRTYCPVSR